MNEVDNNIIETFHKLPTALVAYHDPCTDGFTSYWITQKALRAAGYIVDGLPMQYDEESYKRLHDLCADKNYTEVYIVDFSVPLTLLTSFMHMPYTQFTVLDHHKTAFERYAPYMDITPTSVFKEDNKNIRIYLDNAHSGAGICWDYFNTGAVAPMLVKYVQDYDLWKFEYGRNTKAAALYIRSVQRTLAAWDALWHQLEDTDLRVEAFKEGYFLLEEREKEVRGYAEEFYTVYLEGIAGRFVFCPGEFASDVGNYICQDKNVAFSLSCDAAGLDEPYDITWSLRSSKGSNVDVSALAKMNGGGGHKHAAGFITTLDSALTLLNRIGAL